MLKSTICLSALALISVSVAHAAPSRPVAETIDPDLADKLEKACSAVMTKTRGNALKEKEKQGQDISPLPANLAMVPIEESLPSSTLLTTLEAHFKYAKKSNQRGKDDNKVLACRVTRPGSGCTKFKPDGLGEDESGDFEEVISTQNAPDVVFGEDEPAGKIRTALIQLVDGAGPSNRKSSKPIKEDSFVTRWRTSSCRGSGDTTSVCSDATPLINNGKIYKQRKNAASDEKFDFDSEFLFRLIRSDDVVEVVCVGPTDNRFDDDIITNSALQFADNAFTGTAGQLEKVRTGVTRYTPFAPDDEDEAVRRTSSPQENNTGEEKDTEFTRAVKILKDPSQFAATDPEGFELGTDINLDGSFSDFTLDAALGLTFSAQDASTKCKSPRLTLKPTDKDEDGDKDDGEGAGISSNGTPNKPKPERPKCAGPEKFNGGSRRTYSLYAAYSQKPSKQTTFSGDSFVFPLDPENMIPASPLDPANGVFATETSSFADNQLSAGIRVDYEFLPWFNAPGEKSDENPRPGVRSLGTKSSITLETLTDKEFDLQANRFEISVTPPQYLLRYAPGFRSPVSVFSPRTGAKLTWSVAANLDGTQYSRTPRIRDLTEVFDGREIPTSLPRRDIPDFLRVGANFEAGIKGRFPNDQFGRRAKWNLGYKFMHRESLAGKAADASGDEFSVSVEDLWQTKGKFGFSYINQENAVTLNDNELFKLSVQFKVD